MSDTWLIDKSAYQRLGESAEGIESWLDRINRGLVYVTTVTLLEMGYSARNAPGWTQSIQAPPVANLIVEYLTPAIEDRALDVQRLLAERGQHRAPSIPDLLVAATAEIAGHRVLHVDKDFDLVAAVTGQPVERLAVRSPPDPSPHMTSMT